jgi:hypothetical protein
LFYHTIAAVCIILLVVEVAGYLQGDGLKMAILVGLAILALLAPNIESLTIGKSGIVAALKQGIDENSSKIDDTKSAAREIDTQLDQKITQIFEELKALRPAAAAPGGRAEVGAAGSDRFLEHRPITHKDDPQKGRFGSIEEFNGRRIGAVVEASSVQSNWCKVSLTVTSLPGFPQLSGQVHFFLHNSFRPDYYVVQAINGEAPLLLRAWGAFTVGAVADDGQTVLELDLASSPNVVAPEEWRKR